MYKPGLIPGPADVFVMTHKQFGCNAYCQNGNHAEVIHSWVADADQLKKLMKARLKNTPMEVVDIRPAPEVEMPDIVVKGENGLRVYATEEEHKYSYLMIAHIDGWDGPGNDSSHD